MGNSSSGVGQVKQRQSDDNVPGQALQRSTSARSKRKGRATMTRPFDNKPILKFCVALDAIYF
jgi:hypothetical protein